MCWALSRLESGSTVNSGEGSIPLSSAKYQES